MASSSDTRICVSCGEEKPLYKCLGCQQHFCFNDLGNHHQELEKQLHEIEDQRNNLREVLIEQKKNPNQCPSIEQVNRWEYESIEKIKRLAEERRKSIRNSMIKQVGAVEVKLETFTDELKQIRKKNDFNEIILNKLRRKLKELEAELNKSEFADIYLGDLSSLTVSSPRINVPVIDSTTKWKQNGITVVGGNGRGSGLHQIAFPWAICFDDEGSIYVVEDGNDRVVKWRAGSKTGQVVAGGNERGSRKDQLCCPTNVIVDEKNNALIISDQENNRIVRWPLENGASGETIISNVHSYGLFMDSNDYLYVSDWHKGEVRRWKLGEENGTLVAGGNGPGNRLNQLKNPSSICVDQDQSVYISDWGNDRVMKWPKGVKKGIVVAGGQGRRSNLGQLSRPYGILVDKTGNIYVADSENNRIVRWMKGAREGSVVVGGNGEGNEPNQFNCCTNLSFDKYNNLYVTDYDNHRIQKFEIDN